MANRIPSGAQPWSTNVTGSTAAIQLSVGNGTQLGRTYHITGFNYIASGATGATTVNITVLYVPATGSSVSLGQWAYNIPAAAGVMQAPLAVNLIPPMASAIPVNGNTNPTSSTPVGTLIVQATAAGAGATAAVLNAWGFLL